MLGQHGLSLDSALAKTAQIIAVLDSELILTTKVRHLSAMDFALATF